MTPLSDVFKAYDIRGTVPDQLDATACRAVGAATAAFVGGPSLLVARDMRPSGIELSRAFAEGARSRGVGVIDLGLASTDLLYFAAGRFDLPGAMFTASHNPAAYNGIKLCLAGARPVGRDTGLARIQQEAETLLEAWAGSPPPFDAATAAPYEQRDVLGEYAAHVRSFVDTARLRPLRVVADVANGMGGLVVPAVFAGLPFHVELLFPELDGNFPNHPADPIQPENLVWLQQAVVEHRADVGLAFDGDADRVFLVDERGEPVSGSLTTALVAASMLAKHPGTSVLYNCICSRAVPEVIAEHGGIGVRTRVGHSFIKQVMAETGAVFGGEHSGHYYFRDNYRADSGIIAALVVLELLSDADVPLSELLEPYRRYSASGEINTEVPDPAGVVDALAAEVERAGGALGVADRLDGLTVDRGDWWYNLRPSNTEPLLRLNVEAPDEEACRRHVAEVLADVGRLARPAS
ncbi:MAG: phosphomannomutase/phosphoglucomutase [Actinomycetota bacterium]|jgi:phosphomannomutase|nr:phosphomannomutase/phosphoglucomutase [Actinomycetota bacterium]